MSFIQSIFLPIVFGLSDRVSVLSIPILFQNTLSPLNLISATTIVQLKSQSSGHIKSGTTLISFGLKSNLSQTTFASISFPSHPFNNVGEPINVAFKIYFAYYFIQSNTINENNQMFPIRILSVLIFCFNAVQSIVAIDPTKRGFMA